MPTTSDAAPAKRLHVHVRHRADDARAVAVVFRVERSTGPFLEGRDRLAGILEWNGSRPSPAALAAAAARGAQAALRDARVSPDDVSLVIESAEGRLGSDDTEAMAWAAASAVRHAFGLTKLSGEPWVLSLNEGTNDNRE